FNLRKDNFLRVLVDVTTFFVNLVQDCYQIILFYGRQMECLIYRVRKETIVPNCIGQRMRKQKIRMKNQQISRSTFHRLQIEILYLIWRSKTKNTFVIVVMLLAILDFSLC